MEIAKVSVSGVRAQTVQAEPIPVGIVGATVKLEFTDPLWDGLDKHILFTGAADRAVVFAGDSVELPAAVVAVPNILVKMGVWGVSPDGKIAIPTLWAELGTVKPATDKDMGADPGLPIWEQLLCMIGDLRNLNTADKSNLVAAVNEAMNNTGGGAGGYYTPVVTQPTANTMQISFTPSVATMPAVEPVTINFPGADSSQNANGLTTEAAALLITILRNGVYSTDQSANITALETALGSSGESGGDDSGGSGEDSGGDSGGTETVTYTITNNLVNVTSDNSTASVTENNAYTATLTAADGYELETVTVTMGGVDVTSTVCADGKITIAAVTGNVVITASAAETESGGDETTGETVEMLAEVSVKSAYFTAYSDGGETTATLQLSGSGGALASSEIFEEDTRVKITVDVVSGKPYVANSFASTDWDGVSTGVGIANAYYAENLTGASGWTQSPATFEQEYTVRAGYRLLITNNFFRSDNSVAITVEKVVE